MEGWSAVRVQLRRRSYDGRAFAVRQRRTPKAVSPEAAHRTQCTHHRTQCAHHLLHTHQRVDVPAQLRLAQHDAKLGHAATQHGVQSECIVVRVPNAVPPVVQHEAGRHRKHVLALRCPRARARARAGERDARQQQRAEPHAAGRARARVALHHRVHHRRGCIRRPCYSCARDKAAPAWRRRSAASRARPWPGRPPGRPSRR